MTVTVLILMVVIVYLLSKLIQEQKDREFEVARLKWKYLLRDAELNECVFMFSSSEVSSDQQELPESEQLDRVLHRPTGKYSLLKAGGRFYEWQDDVYEGPPLYPDLGGIIVSGTKCKKLVGVSREQALASLERD